MDKILQIEVRKSMREKMAKLDKMAQFLKSIIIVHVFISLVSAQLHSSNNINARRQKQDNVVAEMQVLCHSDSIVLRVNTNTPFNGMLYAKDAPNSSNCVSEYHSSTNMTFRLPLKACGTLFAEVDDGIEYFNTVVVQPHMRLMTNQGKGYHIRCKYQTRERTIANTHFNVSAAFLMQNGPQASTTPLLATASMPSCTMKIFRSGRDDVAETVKIGDKLIMVIEIDQQDMYGMKITNCVVRDGMNMAEQQLMNELGCPLDETIMPKFDYTNNYTRAAVSFPAHKFPHTSSVYYQCNVRLCINNGNCDQAECAPAAGSASSPSPSSSTGSSSLLGSASSPASSSIAPSGASSTAAAAGGPRRKRFVGHQLAAAKGSAGEQPMRAAGLVAGVLPAPSALRSRLAPASGSSIGNKQAPERQPSEQLSFDVYSELYVSDVGVGESSSGDPNGQQISSDLSSASSNSSPAATVPPNCTNWHRAGLLIALAGCCSVGLAALLACQAGLVGSGARAQQQQLQQPRHSTSAGTNQRAFAYLNNQQQAYQLYQQHAKRSKQLSGPMSLAQLD